MKRNTLILVALLALAGCGGSKELEKSKPTAANDPMSYEKSFRPSDYDMDVKTFLTELKKAKDPKLPPTEPSKSEPLVLTNGFRVQLLATTEVDEVNAMKSDAEAAFVGEWFYVIFDPPTYKLRAGNFLAREDADAYAKLLQDSGYQDAWVVPEKVYKNILPRPVAAPPAEQSPKK